MRTRRTTTPVCGRCGKKHRSDTRCRKSETQVSHGNRTTDCFGNRLPFYLQPDTTMREAIEMPEQPAKYWRTNIEDRT